MTSGGEPPSLAMWLLARAALGPRCESIAGDLIEQYRGGRSAAWFWRQTLSAIVTGFIVELRHHKAVAIVAVRIGTNTNALFMFLVRPRWISYLDGWHRLLINWLLWMEWDAARHVAYHLTGFLTVQGLWCAFVAALAWTLTRMNPRQYGLIVTLLVATAIAQFLPVFMRNALISVREPRTPFWLVDLLSFSVFGFAAAPLSMYLGGRHGAKDQDLARPSNTRSLRL
jgi:hypothetical protein